MIKAKKKKSNQATDSSYQINNDNLQAKLDDIPSDLRNDIQIAFDLYKNPKTQKINLLKTRTILYNFVMYKFSATEINEYIFDIFPNREEYSLEEVQVLVNLKKQNLKDKDVDDLFNLVYTGKNHNGVTKGELIKIYNSVGIETSDREIKELAQYLGARNDGNISKEDFKKFFI